MKVAKASLTNDIRNRMDWGYLAFFAHRLTGLVLGLFIPLHFILLGRALLGEDGLQRGLSWTDHPLLKVVEVGLVLSLTLHLGLGIRLMIIERTGRIQRHEKWALISIAFASCTALLFALSLVI
jgi:fumarate reductase subunit D